METTKRTYSEAKDLVIARRLRRRAEGNKGQIAFLRQTPMWAAPEVLTTVRKQITALREQAARWTEEADLIDPEGLTVGR